MKLLFFVLLAGANLHAAPMSLGPLPCDEYIQHGNYTRADLVSCALEHAPLCGMKTWQMVQSLNSSPVTYLSYTVGWAPMSRDEFNMSECLAAIDLLDKAGDAKHRSPAENEMQAMLSIYTFSNEVSFAVDPEKQGHVSPRLDICTMAGSTEFAQLFWRFHKSIQEIPADFSSQVNYPSLATMTNNLCVALDAIGQGFCGANSPAAVDGPNTKGILSLMKEGAIFGLNQGCAGGSVAVCHCP